MFTGIVEEMGAVTLLEQTLGGTRLTILASTVLADLKIGDSISINGTCLTVVAKGEQSFVVEASPETLSVTTLGQLTGGAPVNLERAMKLNERIGGHLVAGHVDGVGTIRSRRQEGNAIVLVIEAPSDVLRYCVHKGSVTVDGISLTINDATDHSFSVSIIPHTAASRHLDSSRSMTRSTWNPTSSESLSNGSSNSEASCRSRRPSSIRTI